MASLIGYKDPNRVTVTGRKSSITNAFVNGIIPYKKPNQQQVDDALRVLGMTKENVSCAFCGNPYTEWDHINAIVRNKRPTGFITEIHNLVPACGKCNQSKGNRDWREWINSEAKLSPKSRGVSDLNDRISKLDNYCETFKPTEFKFEEIIQKKLWDNHWENYDKIIKMLEEAKIISEKIKKILN